MSRRPCREARCPNPALPDQGRCEAHARKADRDRGTATERGYTSRGHRLVFREGVLARDPICKLCLRAPSTIADHHPLSRRELLDLGLDPNDPTRGRGLCKACHDRETARHQPGGWNAG